MSGVSSIFPEDSASNVERRITPHHDGDILPKTYGADKDVLNRQRSRFMTSHILPEMGEMSRSLAVTEGVRRLLEVRGVVQGHVALVSAQYQGPDNVRAVKGHDNVNSGEVNLRVHVEPAAWNVEERRSPAILTMLASVCRCIHATTYSAAAPDRLAGIRRLCSPLFVSSPTSALSTSHSASAGDFLAAADAAVTSPSKDYPSGTFRETRSGRSRCSCGVAFWCVRQRETLTSTGAPCTIVYAR
ncbi:unnamed protein product [Nippostrongylus brasiliensis]|uniref:Uncharacterized protein n=1 Tax=Nippostrongylus brasiliensis TaxID=27835 RepID=A0A0N4YE70_NIPBR|nr:unnamed protein product [Nippostrongylus brasiliensis]